MTNQVGQGGLRTPATCSTSTLHTRCERTCRAQPRATASQGHVSRFPARCSSRQRNIERAAAGERPKYAPHSGLASIARPWCWEGQPETPRRFRESPRRGLASVARVGRGIPRSPGGSVRARAGDWQALRASELGRATGGSPETRIRPRSLMRSMDFIGEAFF